MIKVIEPKSFLGFSLTAGTVFAFAVAGIDVAVRGPSHFYLPGVILASSLLGLGIYALFSYLVEQSKTFETPDLGHERVLVKGLAGHEMGYEVRGGYLVMTKSTLWFFSNGMNVQNAMLKIDLDDIKTVNGKKLFGIMQNRLSVELASGELHEFIVPSRFEWLESIANSHAAQATAA